MLIEWTGAMTSIVASKTSPNNIRIRFSLHHRLPLHQLARSLANTTIFAGSPVTKSLLYLVDCKEVVMLNRSNTFKINLIFLISKLFFFEILIYNIFR